MTDPGNSSDEVLSEVGVAGPVLRGEAGAGGVVQDGAEPVVLVAWCGGVSVDDESGEELPVGAAADAGLGGVDSEALVADDAGDSGDQVVYPAGGEVAGEGEVVGVPGVGDFERVAEAGEAAVELGGRTGWPARVRWARPREGCRRAAASGGVPVDRPARPRTREPTLAGCTYVYGRSGCFAAVSRARISSSLMVGRSLP